MSAPGFVQHELRLFFTALQFLTRCPVPAWVGHDPAWLNQCVRYFPIVGGLVGTLGAAVLLAASRWWPPMVAACLAVLATVWVTGAFHEDGLADTFDALGGAVPRERALAIMKDSRIGSYGAVALVLSLTLRIGLLAALLATHRTAAALALVASHAMGRTAAVALMASLGYAGDAEHAKAKPLATAVPRAATTAGVVSGIAVVLALAYADGRMLRWIMAVLAALLLTFALRRWFLRRLGGYTGDTLGASEQCIEIIVLMVLAAA
jgi:adenosylcobinamide-GDP ribazoletransferase